MNGPFVWDWTPLKAVGPIVFGSAAAPLIQTYGLQRLEPDCEIADWDTYEFPQAESRVCVRSGVVEDVLCCDALVYQGENLLGIHVDQLRQILGPDDPSDTDLPASIAESLARGEVAYYERLGATFWLAQSRVISASVGPPVEEDE